MSTADETFANQIRTLRAGGRVPIGRQGDAESTARLERLLQQVPDAKVRLVQGHFIWLQLTTKEGLDDTRHGVRAASDERGQDGALLGVVAPEPPQAGAAG